MARVAAVVATLGLVVLLSLNWFAFAPPQHPAEVPLGGGGTLSGYSLKGFHGSGWAGLGWLPVGFLGLAAVGAIAGPPRPALVVAVVALAVLVIKVAGKGDLIALRWPAYAGMALAALLVAAAAAAVRLPSQA